MEDKSFLGTGWAFPPEFHTTAAGMGAAGVRTTIGTLRVSAETDIAQSLRILFGTTPGERVMQPTYGCDLKAMVFEEINDTTLTDIKDVIERAVRFFEPRITLEEVAVDDKDVLEGVLQVDLAYRIRATNTRSNLVFPLYLREGSGVGHRA